MLQSGAWCFCLVWGHGGWSGAALGVCLRELGGCGMEGSGVEGRGERIQNEGRVEAESETKG